MLVTSGNRLNAINIRMRHTRRAIKLCVCNFTLSKVTCPEVPQVWICPVFFPLSDADRVGDQWAAMSPPRLSGALRSFSIVSRKEDLSEQRFDLKVRPPACVLVPASPPVLGDQASASGSWIFQLPIDANIPPVLLIFCHHNVSGCGDWRVLGTDGWPHHLQTASRSFRRPVLSNFWKL